MPVWLRKFTAHKISEFNQKQSKEYEKANKKSKVSTAPKGPAIKSPTYSTKARK